MSKTQRYVKLALTGAMVGTVGFAGAYLVELVVIAVSYR